MTRTLRRLTAASIMAVSILGGYAMQHGGGGTARAERPAGARSGAPVTVPVGDPGEPAGHKVALIMGMPSALGQVVTDDYMSTLYRYAGDSATPPASHCTAACAATWRPVLAGDTVLFDGGDRSLVGTVTRIDGTVQLTLKGWPLYRYSGDLAAGDTKGEGVDGAWSAVTPSGDKA